MPIISPNSTPILRPIVSLSVVSAIILYNAPVVKMTLNSFATLEILGTTSGGKNNVSKVQVPKIKSADKMRYFILARIELLFIIHFVACYFSANHLWVKII